MNRGNSGKVVILVLLWLWAFSFVLVGSIVCGSPCKALANEAVSVEPVQIDCQKKDGESRTIDGALAEVGVDRELNESKADNSCGGDSKGVEREANEPRKVERIGILDLVELALAHNYDLRIRQKEAASAFFEFLKLKGEAGLSLDLTSSLSRSGPIARFRFDPSGPETTFQKEVSSRTSLRLSYPLTPLGNLGYGERAAEAGYLAKQALVDRESAQTISSVFDAYANYLIAEEAVAVAEEGLALAEEQLKNARLRYEEGISPRFEVIQGEVAVSEAKESLIESRNRLELSKSSLFLAVGVDVQDYFQNAVVEIGYEDWLDSLAEKIVREILPSLHEQNIVEAFVEATPEFRSLQSAILSLEYQLKGRRRAPFLSLTAGYTHQTGSSFLKKNTWDYGISGTLNLFDSEKTENWQRALKAQMEALDLQLEKYRQAFKLGIKDKLSKLQASTLGWETARNTLAQAEEALRMARVGYEEGVTTHADLTSSRSAYLAAKLREFSGKLSVISAYQSLLVTLGFTDPAVYLPKDDSALIWMLNLKGEDEK